MDDMGKFFCVVVVFCVVIKYLWNYLVDVLVSIMKGVELNWILENFFF